MLTSRELRTVAKLLRENNERSLAAYFERKADKIDNHQPGGKKVYRPAFINKRIKLRG
jgi:hypothetical protein